MKESFVNIFESYLPSKISTSESFSLFPEQVTGIDLYNESDIRLVGDFTLANTFKTGVNNMEVHAYDLTGVLLKSSYNYKGYSFLATAAENRAFVRAVRNFLKVNLVANEEMGPKKNNSSNNNSSNYQPYSSQSNKISASSYLESILKEKNISFEYLKQRMENEKGFENVSGWSGISDISNNQVYRIIEKIQKAQNYKSWSVL